MPLPFLFESNPKSAAHCLDCAVSSVTIYPGTEDHVPAENGGYLSEASYNADIQKFNKMQSDAQGYLATLERNAQQELLQQQMQLKICKFS